ncbi:MAG: hypothetical protein ACN4G0_00340 [Polyangiales bacterium]
MSCSQRPLLALLPFLGVAIVACGSSTSSPPREVTLSRSTAPAASIVQVDGLDLDACPLRTSEIRVAGQSAPAVLNARHEALMRLPLFYDEQTNWAAPPEGPQDVDIFCNGTLWLTLPAAITITELPPAPGTTEALLADYQQIVSDYRALTEALAPTPGIQQQLFTATFAALEPIVTGADPNGLPAQIDELKRTDPDTLALMDAAYAISDVDQVIAAFKGQLQGLSTKVAASGPVTPASTTPKRVGVYELPFPISMDDANLDEMMSAHHAIDAFGKDFLAQTAESFGNFEGVLSIVIKSKLAAGINTSLSLLDYILNKLVVSAIPSSFDEIDLQLATTLLANSEVTFSQFTVRASNVPERLSITDITSVVLATIGLDGADDLPGADAALPWVKPFEERLQEATKFLLEQLSKGFKEYADANPAGVDYDMEVFAIVPQMRFEALGSTRELYLLLPERDNIVHPLQNKLEWQASDTYWGSSDVYVVPAPGAFGGQTSESNKVRVQVGELAIVLSQHRAVVPENDSASFGVKLSHAPQEPVSVSVQRVSGDGDISVDAPQPMVFDSSNWDSYRDVVLAAADDEDDEDGEATIRASADVESYGTEPITIEASLTAIELDDDRPRFVVDPSSVRVPEGGTATVDVQLSQSPSSTVAAIVTRAGGDTDLEVQSPTIMRFDENNWDRHQSVTLYAHPDEDFEEGRAQFRVSANPPANVDEVFITATEDEEGDRLYFRWFISRQYGNGTITYVVDGTVPLTLDPTNQTTPLGSGTVFASHEDTTVDPEVRETGHATLTVNNHWSDTICYCGSADTANCHTRTDEEQHILAVTIQFPFGSTDGREIVVIVGEDSPFSFSYDCRSSSLTASVEASLE